MLYSMMHFIPLSSLPPIGYILLYNWKELRFWELSLFAYDFFFPVSLMRNVLLGESQTVFSCVYSCYFALFYKWILISDVLLHLMLNKSDFRFEK